MTPINEARRALFTVPVARVVTSTNEEASNGSSQPTTRRSTRRHFLKQSGMVAAAPLMPGGVANAAKQVLRSVVVSNNPVINVALGVANRDLGALTANLAVGATLLEGDHASSSAGATTFVSSFLNNTLGANESSSAAGSLDQSTARDLTYFFDPAQQVKDTIPNLGSGAKYESAMRTAYETARTNRDAFRRDPAVLDYICSGPFAEGSPEEAADAMFGNLGAKVSGVYQGFLQVSNAASIAARRFGSGSTATRVSHRVSQNCPGLKKVNGAHSTHASQNPNIEHRIGKMTEADMDKYDLKKRAAANKNEDQETDTECRALSLIRHFPAIERLRMILESMDAGRLPPLDVLPLPTQVKQASGIIIGV